MLFLISASCKPKVRAAFLPDDKQLAGLEIDTLHQRFNSKDFQAIYDQEAPGLKQAISKDDLFSFLNNVHQQFGDFRKIVSRRISIVAGSPVQLRAVCNSQFDKEILTEMFIFLRDGDQVQLAQYTVAKGPAQLPDVGN